MSAVTEDGRRPTRLPTEIWILAGANVVIALGYGVVAPVLPAYARNFGVSIGAATFVITAFAAMRLIFAPPSGLLVQKLGERRVYLTGLLIVALSTLACAFAQTYWQLLLFRSLGGAGSTMFTVSSLALMIRLSPFDARGRVAGLFSSAFMIGGVAGPVVGSLTAGLGLAVPFGIYGAALTVAAAVVFVSLRHSPLAAPEEDSGPTVSVRTVLRNRAYQAALLSNLASGWAALGLRVALVPLFVVDVLHGQATLPALPSARWLALLLSSSSWGGMPAARSCSKPGGTTSTEALFMGAPLLALRGDGRTLRLGEDRIRFKAGDYAVFPAGEKTGHCLVNETDKPCRYVVIGEDNPNESCVYPDSNKVMVAALRSEQDIFDMAAVKRYWDGEG